MEESCKTQKKGFVPFLVVQSNFRYIVIPLGCYWVPDVYFFNLPLDKIEGGERENKDVPPKQQNRASLSKFVS